MWNKNRTMLVWSVLLILTTTVAVAGVDLRASGISFERTNDGGLEVRGTYGVWHDDSQTPYQIHVELRQFRDGQVIKVLWSNTHGGTVDGSSSCQSGCAVQSCTGTCWVNGIKGSCNVFVENCNQKDGYRECLCELPAGPSLVVDLMPGDIFELAVDPVGVTDLDPSDNVVRMTYR